MAGFGAIFKSSKDVRPPLDDNAKCLSQQLRVPAPRRWAPGRGSGSMPRSGQEGILPPGGATRYGRHDLTGIAPAGIAGQMLVQQRKAVACQGRCGGVVRMRSDRSLTCRPSGARAGRGRLTAGVEVAKLAPPSKALATLRRGRPAAGYPVVMVVRFVRLYAQQVDGFGAGLQQCSAVMVR